jgi:hypothetical protein
MNDAERWLTAVVSQAIVLANEMAQLTACLAAHDRSDPTDIIDTYADALEGRLRDLEASAGQRP